MRIPSNSIKRTLSSSATAFVVALICVLAPLPAAAQWTPGGVNLGGYELDGGGAVSDALGGVIAVWNDRRDGPYPNRFDIYAQYWNSAGVEQWEAGGTPVCTLATDANGSRVASDGAGGAIFVWTDNRTSGAGPGIYAQHVTSVGVHVWTDQGVPVSTLGNFIGNVSAVADGGGGVVVVWVDNRSGGQNVYAQRLDATGAIQWAGDVTVPEAAAAHYTPRSLETLDGGAIIAWVSGPSINRDVYVQRISAVGARVWNSGVATAVCTALQSQSNLALISDGAGGAVVAWEDRRTGDDIYAQRVNSSGATQWAADGVVVVNHSYSQSSPRACPDGTGGAIVMWSDQRDQGSGGGVSPQGDALAGGAHDGSRAGEAAFHNGSAATARITEPDLYMQRLNGSGTAMWTADGIVIANGPNYQQLGKIVSDDAGGAVITWTDDSDDDTNDDVMMQRYNGAGTEMWTAGGVVQATGTGSRQVFAQVSDGAGNTIPLWTTYLASVAASASAAAAAPGSFIYVQKVDNVDGECACGTSTNAGPIHAARPLTLTAAVPNPSAGTTELQMFLERSAEVHVDVYDVRGRRVASQHVGRVADGWRTLRFDGRALPNGVYFYRVTAGAETNTRKIVITR